MRLRRLDLTRYGRFTDDRIVFGPAPADGPDLHIVYGPNEAGKSTALSAFLDLLYGIELRSPYNFLHPYETMRVGAELEGDGPALSLVRVKSRRNSLRDDRDQPVGDHTLGAWLGGIDRDAYRGMFSLDDDTLEQGGEDILKSRGDLGSLLFAASAGLSDLADRLQALEAEADRFHKGRLRSTELADLKRTLKDLDDQRETIDVQASEYRRRVQARDQARKAYEAAAADLSAVRARVRTIDRLHQGLAHAGEVRRLRAEVAALGPVPEPPAAWHEEIDRLREQETALTRDRDGADRRIADLDRALAGITVDEALLEVSERLDRLTDLERRFASAAEDLPRRRLECAARERQISVLLAQLDLPPETDPWALVVPAATASTLRDLIAGRSGIVERREAAQAEYDRALAARDEARGALQRVTGTGDEATTDHEARSDPSVWHALGATVQALRQDQSATRVRLETRAHAGLSEALDEALAALAPWSGDADALAGLPVPDATRLEAWRADLSRTDEAIRTHAGEVARLEGEHARLTAEMEAVRTASGVVDDATAAEVRAARDAAWADHRAVLDAATADAFEAAMRADDAATDGRLTRTTEVARLRQAAVDLATTAQALSHAQAQRDRLVSERTQVCGAVTAALVDLGLPAEWSPASLADWLVRREAALQARAAVRAKAREIREAEEDDRRARARLREALAAVGLAVPPETPLSSLLDTADGVLKHHADKATRLETATKALRLADQAVSDRTRSLDAARAAEADWLSAWSAAVAGCWLGADGGDGGDGAGPDPQAVAGRLSVLDSLRGEVRDRDDKRHRITQMERDQEAFVKALAAVLADLGEERDLDPAQALEVCDALRRRVAAAREAEAFRRDRQTQRAQVCEERAALDPLLASVASRRAEMTALFGVETLADVAAALKKVAQRAGLSERIRAAEHALVDALGVPDTAAAGAVLADADADTLSGEATELSLRLEVLEPQVRDLYAALTMAEHAVAEVGGDDAVARLDARRRTVLLEIEDRATRHLRLRLGIAAAQRALTLYQERHRSAMLARAGQAFSTISRGAYIDLVIQSGAAGDTLVAMDAGGGSKVVSALSKGTRFQLYLALRVAGYHEFAARRPPVPFIADDIMETFDDFRAEEAFRLFADMATVGQVVYLTHHRHLCEIARSVCPSVRVHAMPGSAGVGG